MAAADGRRTWSVPAGEAGAGRDGLGGDRGAAGARGRSRVVWREELGVRLLPGFFDPLLVRVARYVFGRAANRLLRMP